MAFLDETGLEQVWGKVKGLQQGKHGTATLNNSIISSGSLAWHKVGSLVVCSVDSIMLSKNISSTDATTVLFSNLPKCAQSASFLLLRTVENKSMRCMVDKGGTTVRLHYSDNLTPSNSQFYGTFCYVAD